MYYVFSSPSEETVDETTPPSLELKMEDLSTVSCPDLLNDDFKPGELEEQEFLDAEPR